MSLKERIPDYAHTFLLILIVVVPVMTGGVLLYDSTVLTPEEAKNGDGIVVNEDDVQEGFDELVFMHTDSATTTNIVNDSVEVVYMNDIDVDSDVVYFSTRDNEDMLVSDLSFIESSDFEEGDKIVFVNSENDTAFYYEYTVNGMSFSSESAEKMFLFFVMGIAILVVTFLSTADYISNNW